MACCGKYQMFVTGYSITAGATERLLFGYDSYGNVCGRRNSPIKGAPLSGQDMTDRKEVFFLNSCNLEIRNMKINSIALCVSSCPREQLNNRKEVQRFAERNGSYLCVYSLNSSEYTLNAHAAELCPMLPVPPSKSFPLFRRCIPQTPECYSQFVPVLINVVNEMDLFHRIIAGIMTSKDSIIGLCALAVVFSLIMVAIFRFIAVILVHILIALVVFGLLFVSSVLWWLYYDHVTDPSIELESEKENSKFLLAFAVGTTVISIIIFVLILVMWRRLKLMTELFRVASETISAVPLLLLQPVWTFIILIFFWAYWVAVLLSLGTAEKALRVECRVRPIAWTSPARVQAIPLPTVNGGSQGGGAKFSERRPGQGASVGQGVLGSLHTSDPCGLAGRLQACLDKNNPPSYPILSSISNLFNYHLGTVAKGSLIITLVRIPRVVLTYIHSTLQGKNAYTATAINGTDFCTSAKEAFFILVKNSLNIAAINSFGDFLLFLGKVCFILDNNLDVVFKVI
ncbi:UNVERIFIED_CONTAM: hypothetical protein FKN15_050032 [Acipenser sinensis]